MAKSYGKRIFDLGLVGAISLFLVIMGCNLWVTGSTAQKIYGTTEKVPYREVGLVLGTTPRSVKGGENLHFVNRMKAAADLYKAGKIDHVLVSGDNRDKRYNEPAKMRDRLVELGVPPAAITSDFAGLRTLDSIVRADKVWGLENFTVISDDFHVARAVFLAHAKGMKDVIAFRSAEVASDKSGKSRTREYLARVKAVLDIILGTDAQIDGDGKEPEIVVQKRDGSAKDTSD
ncbi:YdcF family protein [Verrucomicrobiales bacterium]|nr:YdcF family protein [Verrucomicrobiales bacterium]